MGSWWCCIIFGFLSFKSVFLALWSNFINSFIMAKIKFGAMMVDARGKLGGHVFSKNRGGAYVRTKVTPANPQTADQVEQRARLATASQGWKALTEAQRLSWNGAVGSYQSTNVFGDIVNPSGAQLHTRLNVNIALAGGTAIAVPPLPVGIASPAGLSVVADTATPELTIDWTSGPVPAGVQRIVETSPMVSPGIYNANTQLRVITTLAPATATGVNVISSYTAKFGSLVAGQKLFVRIRDINKTTGEVSQSLVTSVIVA